ncbi:MAG TPA: winged helix DNA-binding domain-containing protein [Actinomycetota bacterium]|nr:winged helix DNA-binding domain-containing protein [Actinomycetota bacterium]
MRTIGVAERRARLGVRHFLAKPAQTVEDAAAAMVGLHSSDPTSVFVSARARLPRMTREDLEDALYERRSLVRMLGMRGTLFVTTPTMAADIDAACTKAIAAVERRRIVKLLQEQGIARDGDAWLNAAIRDTMAALHEHGELAGAQLSKLVPVLNTKIRYGSGVWTAEGGMTTRVVFLLAAEGAIVRGRPRGTWISGQYRWVPTDTWLGAPLPAVPTAEASAALLRAWLTAYGPGTMADIRWWTAWTVRQTKDALDALEVEEVALDGGDTGFVLADDVAPVRSRAHWVAFLPGLDATTMGWKERDWYLGAHGPALFDRNGNAGPTVWVDGRVVGGWSQRENGDVVYRLLERVDAATKNKVNTERDRLTAWFGGTRITPRFRSPLEKELAQS